MNPVSFRRTHATALVCAVCLGVVSAARAQLVQSFSRPTTTTRTGRGFGTMVFDAAPSESGSGGSTVVLPGAEQPSTETVLPDIPAEGFRNPAESDGAATGTPAGPGEPAAAAANRLPVRADRGTTEAQARQILEFESRNRLAEAFLLARDLVARDAGSEFALDAAIRTSLALGREADAEGFYRRALARRARSGKYWVQYAHFLARTGRGAKAAALADEYRKSAGKDPELGLTLARLRAVTGDEAGLKANLTAADAGAAPAAGAGKRGKAGGAKRRPGGAAAASVSEDGPEVDAPAPDSAAAATPPAVPFPLVQLAVAAARALDDEGAAAKLLGEAAERDPGPWERRALLLDQLKLATADTVATARLLRGALANETAPARAGALATRAFERARLARTFAALRSALDARAQAPEAADVDKWLASAAAAYALDGPAEMAALGLAPVVEPGTGSGDAATTMAAGVTGTPVLAFARARALLSRGRADEAADALEDLLAEQPEDGSIRLELSRALAARGRHAAALATLTARPADADPADETEGVPPAARRELGTSSALALADAGRLADAWRALAEGATADEAAAMARQVETAPGVLAPSDLRSRIEALAPGRDDAPGADALLALRAALAAREGDRAAALRLWLRFAARRPAEPAALALVAKLAAAGATGGLGVSTAGGRGPGRMLRATDSEGTELSLRLDRRLIELQPRVAERYAALTGAYLQRGEPERARRVAAELVEKATSAPEALSLAARGLLANDLASASLPFFREAITAQPRDVALRLEYARALRLAGKGVVARSILLDVLENGLDGKPFAQERALVDLADLAAETGPEGVAELAAELDALREKDVPGKGLFLAGAGRVLLRAGAPDRAAAFLEPAAAGQSGGGPALAAQAGLLLAKAKEAQGDAEGAAKARRAVIDHDPASAPAIEAAWDDAEARRRAGRPGDAVDAWTKLAAAAPQSDRALAALHEAAMVAFYDIGDRALAATLMRRFLDSPSQDFELRSRARTRLERIGRGLDPLGNPAPATTGR